jgi:hypothetical protein
LNLHHWTVHSWKASLLLPLATSTLVASPCTTPYIKKIREMSFHLQPILILQQELPPPIIIQLTSISWIRSIIFWSENRQSNRFSCVALAGVEPPS